MSKFPFLEGQSHIAQGFPHGCGKESTCNAGDLQERQVRSLGQKDPLEYKMATRSSILAWEVPWTKEFGRLQSMGSQKSNQITTKQQAIAIGPTPVSPSELSAKA